MICPSRLCLRFATLSLLLLTVILWQGEAKASNFTLLWVDNSTNEDGFKIERNVNGNYIEIASVGPNLQTYTDSGLLAGVTYCYRVRAFNSGVVSSPSNESCVTAPVTNFALTLSKTGNGTGLVSSSPVGINCGSDCSQIYPSGTVVSLTATPVSGSTFGGWSGDADCADGKVTLDSNKSCTAIFSLAPQTFTLNVSVVNTLATTGAASGTVTSAPAGIICGADCSENYLSGTFVKLTATPATGSTFAGWGGDPDCADGSITMNSSKNCTATFTPPTQIFDLYIRIAGSGIGTVTSSPFGINCGTDCSEAYDSGTVVTLNATPLDGSDFLGWSGSGCNGTSSCTVKIEGNTSVTATFDTPVIQVATKIGIFRPSTGEWFLDLNGNGLFEGCGVDTCLGPYGQDGMLPVVGDWNDSGTSNVGTFDVTTGVWYLDHNGNGLWDGCGVDICISSFGEPGDFPVVRSMNNSSALTIGVLSKKSAIGIFQPETIIKRGKKNIAKTGVWKFDLNGNKAWDGCQVDSCSENFGRPRDIPVVGDWNGTGTEEIGYFRPSTGEWFLDLNGNGKWDRKRTEKPLGPFGNPLDLPVVGDWDASGKTRIGVFRPHTGEWLLDLNGNGQWDGCQVDGCLGPFGQEGDIPVAGKW